jgi:hypothetical protein
VVFFIALQIYANRNLAARKKNWALMISALASYCYGVWTNIVGVLAFGNISIKDITFDTCYLLIIPIMVGIPLEIAPEALIIMGFFPESSTVISDAVSGIGGVFRAIFGQGGSRIARTSNYHPADRPSVDDLSSSRPVTSRSSANPRNQPASSAVRSAPMSPPTADDANDPWHYLH